MKYVEWYFGFEGFNCFDIVNFYCDVKVVIVKVDFFCYIVMYVEGGLYVDIDVEVLKFFFKFIFDCYNVKDIDMVIGVEIDEFDWKDYFIFGFKLCFFCQWIFMCKFQLFVMMRFIEQIMIWFNGVVKEQNVFFVDVKFDFDQIISGIGLFVFIIVIFVEMDFYKEDFNIKVDWDFFYDFQEFKFVSCIFVFIVEVFVVG